MRRTNRESSVKCQIEDLTVENEGLKAANKSLRKENSKYKAANAKLHIRLEAIESTLESRIAKAVEEAVSKATKPLLAATIAALRK